MICTPDTWTIRSDKDAQFTGAIAQNAIELESFGTLVTPKVVISRITILSDQNLSWRLIFFSTAAADDTDADVDSMVDWFDFVDTSGFQIAGAGLYRYAASGLEFHYGPAGRTLHVALMNLSAAGKNAGATGEVVVEVSGPIV